MCISVQPLLDRLGPAGDDLLVAHHVTLGVAQVGAERAEHAAVHAHVGRIEVRVDVVVGGSCRSCARAQGWPARRARAAARPAARARGRRRAKVARPLRLCREWASGWESMCEAWGRVRELDLSVPGRRRPRSISPTDRQQVQSAGGRAYDSLSAASIGRSFSTRTLKTISICRFMRGS